MRNGRGAGWLRPVPMQALGIVLALGVALVLLLARPALALYNLEAGGYAMAGAEAYRAAHPAADNELLDRALRHFQVAVDLSPTDGYAYRRLGQAWLLAGNNDAARQALTRATELRPHDPMIHIELGDAWSGLGQAEKAVAEYEQGRYGPATREAVLNYLKVADWRIAAGSGDVALKILQDKVLAFDPHNLAALYRVATIYEGMSQEASRSAAPIRTQLKQFREDILAVPAWPPLAGYLAQAMISLTEDGTWTQETLHNVAAYQVWQFANGAQGLATEQVMQTLAAHWPDDVDLRFYLAETYQRRGELDQADATYREVLGQDPKYAAAALRLGMVAEARGAGPGATQGLEEAAQWYRRYLQLAPDDLQGLRRLAEVLGALDSSEAAGVRERLTALTDDRRIVADLLDRPVAGVDLGPNLLQNGSFEAWPNDKPSGWLWSDMANHEPFAPAAFVGGADELLASEGERGARVDGLWAAQPDGKQEPRAGFWRIGDDGSSPAVQVDADQLFLLSFDYLTTRGPDRASTVWVAADPGRVWAEEPRLPATGGQWRHFVGLAANRTGAQTALHPLLRSWAPGEVVFDNVQIRAVQLPQNASSLAPGDVRVWVAGHGE